MMNARRLPRNWREPEELGFQVDTTVKAITERHCCAVERGVYAASK